MFFRKYIQKTKLVIFVCSCYLFLEWQRYRYSEKKSKSLVDSTAQHQKLFHDAINTTTSDNFNANLQNEFEDTKEAPVTVHMGAVSYGKKYGLAVLAAIKLILLLTDASLQWYVFTNDNTTEIITSGVNLWPDSFKNRLTVTEVPLHCNKWMVYFNNSYPLKGMALKQCVFTGIQYSFVRNYTDKLIFVDLDTYIFDDIIHLWNWFSLFTEDHIMALARADHRYLTLGYSQYTYDQRYGINSGVVLMHLKRMADFNFEDKYIHCSKLKHYYRNPHTKNINSKDDQNVLSLLFFKYPHMVLPLSCNWNYRPSMDATCDPGDTFNCDEAISQGVSIIHAYGSSHFFLRTNFVVVYNCTQTMNLYDVDETVRCLHAGITFYKNKRREKCQLHMNNLRPLETALKKHHSHI